MQYPNNIKKTFTKLNVSHSNRGMNLENAINQLIRLEGEKNVE